MATALVVVPPSTPLSIIITTPIFSSPIAKPFPLKAQRRTPLSLFSCSSSKNEHQQLLQALSVLVIQSLELLSTLILLRFTSKPEYELARLLKPEKLQNERNWLLASLLGFALLLLFIFLTSYLADSLVGSKDVNDPVLKEILSSGPVSLTACVLVYCLITPMLEEVVYRRFLLTSLASKMKWQQAVIISSAIFSAAHLSSENLLQLFIIGSMLGCTYSWTGDLRSSIALHSMYNAFTLLVTFLA